MTFEQLKFIADGGVLLVLVFVIYIAWDMAKRFSKTISNHMEHDIESRNKLTQALTSLTEQVEKFNK